MFYPHQGDRNTLTSCTYNPCTNGTAYPNLRINMTDQLRSYKDGRKESLQEISLRPLVLSIPKPLLREPYKAKLEPTIFGSAEGRKDERDERYDIPHVNGKAQPETRKKKKIKKVREKESTEQAFEFKSKRLQKRREKEATSEMEFDNNQYECQVSLFDSLLNVLKLIFLNENANDEDFVLRSEEATILETLIEKKFQTRFGFESIMKQEQRLKLVRHLKKKRADELTKFIFKNAFKYLTESFNAKHDLNRKGVMKNEKRDRFFEYYFGELSRRKKRGIELYYLPIVPSNLKIAKKAKPSRTLNFAYISSLFESEEFLADFRSCIRDHIRDFCVENVKKKFSYLIGKWEKICKSPVINERCFYTVCDDIEFNKKCKLPWTIYEIDENHSSRIPFDSIDDNQSAEQVTAQRYGLTHNC